MILRRAATAGPAAAALLPGGAAAAHTDHGTQGGSTTGFVVKSVTDAPGMVFSTGVEGRCRVNARTETINGGPCCGRVRVDDATTRPLPTILHAGPSVRVGFRNGPTTPGDAQVVGSWYAA